MAGRAGATALCALCLAAPVVAASDHAQGDGSDADNERLLPDVYPTDPVLANGNGLREPYDPFFDVNWSVSLRGSYTKSTDGEQFDTIVVPGVSLEHIGTRSAANFDASAEITRASDDGAVDLGALRLGLQSGYALDSVTRLTVGSDLSITRDSAGTPGLATDIAIAPQTISGAVDAGLTRQFGKFNIGVTGALARNVYGETTLVDASVTDNSDQNYWSLDGGLRIGVEATPIFEVFGQADVGRDMFDTGATNASDSSLRGGVTGQWSSILEATASAGLGLRRFDAAGLDEVVTQLYDAQIIFTPDPTWRLTAGFGTTVAPPGVDGSGTTRVDYSANAELAYTVNSWLALRAMADWNTARFAASADTERGYGFGAGADYKVNAHTAVTADYSYDQTDSTANGLQDAHRVSLGVTLSR